MVKRKKTNENLWQKHLETLEDANSAESFFVNQLHQQQNTDFFENPNDFFVSPLVQPESELTNEGQLALDIYQTDDLIVVKATLAGVDSKDLEINVDNDVLTIRGERRQEKVHDEAEYYYQECYWGKFSRSVVLPGEVDVKKINAKLKSGVLTIVLPKIKSLKSLKVKVIDEN